MSDAIPLVARDIDDSSDVVAAEKNARLIRITSRVGVWGLVGGMVPAMAAAFDLGVPVWLAAPLMGIGLVVSGIGTTAASWIVLRALRGRSAPLLRAASIAGLPLGVALALWGTTAIWHWTPLVQSLGTTIPAALIFGVLVVLFLVARFLLQWAQGDDAGPPSKSTGV